jgi:hypothetical protein
MRRQGGWRAVVVRSVALAALVPGTVGCGAVARAGEPALVGRVVAVGLPGAGPVAMVGRFLPGGPIHDQAAFAAFTQPGRVLDPTRLLVGTHSNLGATPAVSGERPGTIVSIDPTGSQLLTVPADLAGSGGQATAAGGRIQLFSAQAPEFVNGLMNPQAATAAEPAVSNILGLSLNNAFGRIWPANAPWGLNGMGAETILDPGGMPLAGAPDTRAGGVYLGSVTNRVPAQVTRGSLDAAAVGTALIGRALDNPKRAVFAVVTADGAVVQAHTEQGVDGLAPPGTISDLRRSRSAGDLHVGAVLRYYAADPVLYVSDPVAGEVVALTLGKDDAGKVRRLSRVERFRSGSFSEPVDLAPTVPEHNHRDWSSNTTLAELADIYVLNRGNNTIARMKTDGTVIAVRRVVLGDGDLGPARLNGIATSGDGSRIYVTVTGRLPGHQEDGAVLELPAFTAEVGS